MKSKSLGELENSVIVLLEDIPYNKDWIYTFGEFDGSNWKGPKGWVSKKYITIIECPPMPEEEKPSGDRGASAKRARRCKCTRKCQGMWNDNQRREKIAVREEQDCVGTADREITEEENCRDKVGDEYHAVNCWNEAGRLQRGHGREWGDRSVKRKHDRYGQDC